MLVPVWPPVDVTRSIPLVGMTHITGKVTRAERRSRPVELRFIVDSGAIFSVLPESVWKRLRLRPRRKAEFSLADGTLIERSVSRCTFEIAGVSETSPVILGGPRDAALLGMVTLETLGLMLNPLNRTLQPMRMILARSTRALTRASTAARPA